MRKKFLLVVVAFVGWIAGNGQTLAQNAYITNCNDNTVSVVATATNTVTGAPIPVGQCPFAIGVTPDGSKVYVVNNHDSTVSVIDTASSMVTATIPVGSAPFGVAITPDGSKAYVSNSASPT
jgi:YVTN family beta-propeller protein